MQTSSVIEMKNITKRFGDFYANKNINFDLKRGEIHALLGENGAGKSTLMNMLAGLLTPTDGEIYLKGQPVTIDSPSKSNELGIGMVHQHFMLIDSFTVIENIILGEEPVKGIKVDIKKAREEILKLSAQYGLMINPDAKIENISVGMQQRIEILKTLYRGADILIFDEPTAVLTPQEIDDLIVTLRHLADEGKSIIIITHKLDEIKKVADRCTIIRRGESIDTVDVAMTSSQEMASMMVGRDVSFTTQKEKARPTNTVLEVKNLVVKDDRDVDVVENLSFTMRNGEILGIAGVDGNGQSELILALTGLMPIANGEIIYKGESIVNRSPREIVERGLTHIPEDRHKYGLVLDFPISQNFILQDYYKAPYSKYSFLQEEAIQDKAKRLMEQYDVRAANQNVPASALSGGNQQKAIIARELDLNPDLLIAANPTRGLDVGAIEFIHRALIEERDSDKAVLLMSFELDEILNLSDRILVMYDGAVIADLPREETNKEELGLMMAGTPYEEVVKQRKEGAL